MWRDVGRHCVESNETKDFPSSKPDLINGKKRSRDDDEHFVDKNSSIWFRSYDKSLATSCSRFHFLHFNYSISKKINWKNIPDGLSFLIKWKFTSNYASCSHQNKFPAATVRSFNQSCRMQKWHQHPLVLVSPPACSPARCRLILLEPKEEFSSMKRNFIDQLSQRFLFFRLSSLSERLARLFSLFFI